MEKACTVCNEVKALDEFHRDSRRSDGRRSACKACVNEQARMRRTEEEAPNPTTELLNKVKVYKKDGQDLVKAIDLRNEIKKVTGKNARNVKNVFDDILHFENKEMVDVLGEDYKYSRHGFIMLTIEQAKAFTEKHIGGTA